MQPSFSAGEIPTRVIVRVTSNDAKVIGSGVGGAFVRIKNLKTGEIFAQGKQLGEQVRPTASWYNLTTGRGTLWSCGHSLFTAEIPLEKPTPVEIYAEAPLAYPQSIQKGSKTLTLIPGSIFLGWSDHWMNGLIVNVISPHRKIV